MAKNTTDFQKLKPAGMKVSYTQQELMQAAKEVANLPNESQIVEMMADYSKLRDACRLAEKELKKQR